MEKSSETSMRDCIATVAGPRGFNDTRQSWLARAARKSGVTFRQAKALFYGEITDPNHLAARRMKDAAIEAGRKEARSLANQLRTIAGGLNAADADFHRDQINTLLVLVGELGPLDRTRT